MSRRQPFAVATLFMLSALAAAPFAQQTARPALADLKTTAEATDYKSTSTYADVVRFMKAVEVASPIVHYTTYGITSEGREMPMAVVGTGLTAITPAAVKATGKLRVHIQGNIHAGEVEGKEAAQVLLREFAQGQHKDWLEKMVFLITPIFNADGNERMAMNNRGPQNGPINGQGTRANAQGLNINRDFMKLETPEARAFAKLWNEYDPHVGFDLHTSDGSTHAYYLTYAPGLNPNTSAAILDLQKNEWFPAITKQIKAKHGWDTFYYGNVSGGQRGRRGGGAGAPAGTPVPEVVGAQVPQAPAPMPTWATFEHVPRFHNNYVGLRNRFALLSEAYAYATFKDRITVTNYFMEEALNWANAHVDAIKKACAAADAEALAGKTLETRAQIKREGTVTILMGEVEDELNPNNGARMNRRKDVVKPTEMVNGLWFAPTATETAPAEFYLPASETKAIELLKLHGVQMRQLTAAIPAANVQEFAITGNTQRNVSPQSIDFGTHGLRTLTGEWQASSTPVPAGSYAISLKQPLGKLAFYLLAPTSDDGVVNWNFLDEALGGDAKIAPMWRKR